ncbi:MAG: hypothetical protein WDW38_006393 [Sanguina aurantia]
MRELVPHTGDPFAIFSSTVSEGQNKGKGKGATPTLPAPTSHGGLRMHVSRTKIDGLRQGTNARRSSPGGNLGGFWYAFDGDWITLQEGDYDNAVGRFVYDVELGDCLSSPRQTRTASDASAKRVVVILDLMDALDFHALVGESTITETSKRMKQMCAGFEVRFRPPQTDNVLSEMRQRLFGPDPNSEKVYDAQFKTLLRFTNTKDWMSWLHGMDIASGCIWSSHGVVTSLRELPVLSSLLMSFSQVKRIFGQGTLTQDEDAYPTSQETSQSEQVHRWSNGTRCPAILK